MPNDATIAELFDLAIAAEQTCEALYRGLADRFAHHPDVADFWAAYADEEADHARWLARLRVDLSAETLAAPADPTMLQNARHLRQFSVVRALADVRNLEDAYQLASEFENSETNVIFEFLVTNFAADARTQSFLKAQVREHIARLANEFPIQYRGVVVRRATKAR